MYGLASAGCASGLRVRTWAALDGLAWFTLLMAVPVLVCAQLEPSTSPEFQRGKELARKYCVGCHLFPAPELLDKETWEKGTLPFLRGRLGIDRLSPLDPDQKQVLEEWELVWK